MPAPSRQENHSKMIELISEKNDKTTDMVIEWLMAMGVPYKRLNFEDFSKFSLRMGKKEARILIKETPSEESAYWIRRGRLRLTPNSLNSTIFYRYLRREEQAVIDCQESILKQRGVMLGSYTEEHWNNKLLNLQVARKCGFRIPETLVTNDRSSLKEFMKACPKVLSKCIFQTLHQKHNAGVFTTASTFLVDDKHVKELGDVFSITLFQEYIEKQYEVRVFFFRDRFYAMGIFSQKDEQTQLDFRNYNKERPNRNVPFNLPDDILTKLMSFTEAKEMDTGSFDLIVTPSDDFVFLEVNPQGQFHWLSKNCNYYIEKDMAEELSASSGNIPIN